VEIAITDWLCRRYREGLAAANEAITLAPDQAWPYLVKGCIYWGRYGASDEARKTFEFVPSDHDWWPWVWYWQLMYEGKFTEAIDRVEAVPGGWIRIKIDAKPAALYEATAYEALGQTEPASAAYEKARAVLETEAAEYPEDPRYHSSLGIVYAALGRSEDALREGNRAVELLPLSKDAMYGLSYLLDLAHIYTLLGDSDNALATIEELLAVPSNLSPPLLEVDPRWSKLRDHPGVQKLLKKYPVEEE